MKNIEEIRLAANDTGVLTGCGVTAIDNKYYETITGVLLWTNISRDTRYHQHYMNYFVTSNKLEIAPGAPVTEYEYNERYIYVINSITNITYRYLNFLI